MTTFYHTPITVGASANASTFNAVYAEIDESIRDLNGYGNAADKWLLENYNNVRITGNIVEGDPGIIEQADIIWPDGSAGLYTVSIVDPVWLEAVEWNITHNLSGKTVEGSGLTRNSDGLILTPEVIVIT